MSDTYAVVSKVKKKVKELGYRTGKDYTDALSRKIEEISNFLIWSTTVPSFHFSTQHNI